MCVEILWRERERERRTLLAMFFDFENVSENLIFFWFLERTDEFVARLKNWKTQCIDNTGCGDSKK